MTSTVTWKDFRKVGLRNSQTKCGELLRKKIQNHQQTNPSEARESLSIWAKLCPTLWTQRANLSHPSWRCACRDGGGGACRPRPRLLPGSTALRSPKTPHTRFSIHHAPRSAALSRCSISQRTGGADGDVSTPLSSRWDLSWQATRDSTDLLLFYLCVWFSVSPYVSIHTRVRRRDYYSPLMHCVCWQESEDE